MYTLENVNLLLIDGQPFMRNLTEGALRQFGFKKIQTLSSADEALVAVQNSPPDLIIVDHVLRPQDGVFFTFSLRAMDTDVRFTPVLFTSSVSAKRRVYMARDAGITEFLARPFSAESLYRRIYQIVEHPRAFVQSAHFKGPDRRRHGLLSVTQEKRSKTIPKDVRLIEPENILRQKVGMGGLPPAVIRAAQIQMEEEAGKMLLSPIVMKNLEWQRGVLNGFSQNDASSSPGMLKDIQDAWSLMKGNAASFGFSLAAKIASGLNDFLENVTVLNEDVISIIEAHESAMHAVIKNNVRDKAEPLGQTILDELQRATARYFKKHSLAR